MLCSVCGAPAKNIAPGDFDGLIVSCTHCREYEIAGTVVNKLLRLSLSERQDVLEKARRQASPGQRPAITNASF
jgi:hypothetical protein